MTLTGAGPVWGASDLLKLCQIVDCTKVYKTPPQILIRKKPDPAKIIPKIKWVTEPITPGGKALIDGSGFGISEGKSWLLFKIQKGYSYLLKTKKLPIKYWSDQAVTVDIPADIVGVKDQKMGLWVVTKGGLSSKKWDVDFEATREIKKLDYDDPAVTLGSCGFDSDADRCNEVEDPEDSILMAHLHHATISGTHRNSDFCCAYDKGSDWYNISLKNGWVFEDVDVSKYFGSDDEVLLGPQPKMPKGGTKWSPGFNWIVSLTDYLNYYVTVYIKGPIGVPHY